MDHPQALTFNGVLYLSLGFRQEYCLQVLTSRRGEEGELQLVLYDGITYIGALYPPQGTNRIQRPENAARMTTDHSDPREPVSNNVPEAQEYDVVRVLPLAASHNQPMYDSNQVDSSNGFRWFKLDSTACWEGKSSRSRSSCAGGTFRAGRSSSNQSRWRELSWEER